MNGPTLRCVSHSTTGRVSSTTASNGIGNAIESQAGAEATVVDSLVEDVGQGGMVISGGASSGSLEGSVIRRVGKGESGGVGLLAELKGALEVVNSQVDGVNGMAADVRYGGTVKMTNSSVTFTSIPSAGEYGGEGFQVMEGATLELTSSEVIGNASEGISVWDAGTSATVTDSVVSYTQPYSDGTVGMGLEVRDGASLTVSTSLLLANSQAGLQAQGEGTQAKVLDCSVKETLPGNKGYQGRGLVAGQEAALTVMRSMVSGNRDSGIVGVAPGTEVTVTSSVVEGTTLTDSEVFGGAGILAVSGASLKVEASLLDGNEAAGVAVAFGGSTSEVSLTVIRETTPALPGA